MPPVRRTATLVCLLLFSTFSAPASASEAPTLEVLSPASGSTIRHGDLIELRFSGHSMAAQRLWTSLEAITTNGSVRFVGLGAADATGTATNFTVRFDARNATDGPHALRINTIADTGERATAEVSIVIEREPILAIHAPVDRQLITPGSVIYGQYSPESDATQFHVAAYLDDHFVGGQSENVSAFYGYGSVSFQIQIEPRDLGDRTLNVTAWTDLDAPTSNRTRVHVGSEHPRVAIDSPSPMQEFAPGEPIPFEARLVGHSPLAEKAWMRVRMGWAWFDAGPVATTGNETRMSMRLPGRNETGAITLTVSMWTDADPGNYTSVTATIQGTPPTLAVDPPHIEEGRLYLSGTAGDEDGRVVAIRAWSPQGEASTDRSPFALDLPAATKPGTHTAWVAAIDDDSLWTTHEVQYELVAPTIAVSRVVVRDGSIHVDGNAADADGRVVRIDASNELGNATTTEAWFRLALPAASSEGTHTFDLAATDDDGLTSVQVVSYEVAAPKLWLHHVDAHEGLLTIGGSAHDSGGGSVVVRAESGGEQDSTPTNGDFRFLLPAATTAGTHAVTVTAIDAAGLSTTLDAAYDLLAPTIVLSRVEVVGAMVEIEGTARDDGRIVSLTAETASVWTSASDPSRFLMRLPASSTPGEHAIHILAQDDDLLTTMLATSYSIDAPCSCLRVVAPGPEGELRQDGSVTLEYSPAPPAGTSIAGELTLDGIVVRRFVQALDADGRVVIQVAAHQVSPARRMLGASAFLDGSGESYHAAPIPVWLTTPNRPPLIESVTWSVSPEPRRLDVSATVSDAEGYVAMVTLSTPWGVLDATEPSRPSFVVPLTAPPGNYTLTLVAIDERGDARQHAFRIDVPNFAPKVSVLNATHVQGYGFRVHANATDVDGSIRRAIISTPYGSVEGVRDSETGFTFSLAAIPRLGTVEAKLIVTDDLNAMTVVNATIEVVGIRRVIYEREVVTDVGAYKDTSLASAPPRIMSGTIEICAPRCDSWTINTHIVVAATGSTSVCSSLVKTGCSFETGASSRSYAIDWTLAPLSLARVAIVGWEV